ncbi:MAG: phosphoribosylaminoimidazolecarboxamide formyltransferase, partial [Pseudomonadota bacterium]
AAASFKHVSPAGAAVAGDLSADFLASQFFPKGSYSGVASAYARARAGDRLCAFGDAAAVSDTVDVSLATLLKGEVSDLIIAPSYDPEALDILKKKKSGQYLILQIEPDYEPPAAEERELFGFRFKQQRNTALAERSLFETFPSDVSETAIVATTALKYAQSNSVCVGFEGQVIGLGAGQQSRVHCTRLACDKADKWMLTSHPAVRELAFVDGMSRQDRVNVVDQYLLMEELSDAELTDFGSHLDTFPSPLSRQDRETWIRRHAGLCLSSDAFIPFRDNIDRASRSGVGYVVHPGGSVRDAAVREACDEYGMSIVETGMRCFLH